MSLVLLCGISSADEARVTEMGHIEVTATTVRVFRDVAQTPLFGTLSQAGSVARFVPALPLVVGETYRVEFQRTDGVWDIQKLRFDLPRAPVPSVRIAPFPAVLPANALKLYLHFTQPMEQGVFLERLSLSRQDGSIVHGPFRETELWSPDGKRLTLWLHPGRQKTGVNLNRDEGPVLVEGQTHHLKISGSWRSSAGMPLGRDLSLSLTVTAPDHTCPDPARWQIKAPKAGSRDPLVIHFDEALDTAMLASALTVEGLTGAVEVAPDGRYWSWTPAQPWASGTHDLALDPLLEDLAGNNLQHPFEVDRENPAKPAPQTTMTFEVR